MNVDKSIFTILSLIEKPGHPAMSVAAKGALEDPNLPAPEKGTVHGETTAIAAPAGCEGMPPVGHFAGSAFPITAEMSALVERFNRKRDRERSSYWSVFTDCESAFTDY